MHSANLSDNVERPHKGLTLEARHTLSLESSRKKSQSVASSLFIPKSMTLPKKPAKPSKGLNRRNLQKRLYKKRQRRESGTLKHPISFPLMREEVSRERVLSAAQKLRIANVGSDGDNKDDDAGSFAVAAVIENEVPDMPILEQPMDVQLESSAQHTPATADVVDLTQDENDDISYGTLPMEPKTCAQTFGAAPPVLHAAEANILAASTTAQANSPFEGSSNEQWAPRTAADAQLIPSSQNSVDMLPAGPRNMINQVGSNFEAQPHTSVHTARARRSSDIYTDSNIHANVSHVIADSVNFRVSSVASTNPQISISESAYLRVPSQTSMITENQSEQCHQTPISDNVNFRVASNTSMHMEITSEHSLQSPTTDIRAHFLPTPIRDGTNFAVPSSNTSMHMEHATEHGSQTPNSDSANFRVRPNDTMNSAGIAAGHYIQMPVSAPSSSDISNSSNTSFQVNNSTDTSNFSMVPSLFSSPTKSTNYSQTSDYRCSGPAHMNVLGPEHVPIKMEPVGEMTFAESYGTLTPNEELGTSQDYSASSALPLINYVFPQETPQHQIVTDSLDIVDNALVELETISNSENHNRFIEPVASLAPATLPTQTNNIETMPTTHRRRRRRRRSTVINNLGTRRNVIAAPMQSVVHSRDDLPFERSLARGLDSGSEMLNDCQCLYQYCSSVEGPTRNSQLNEYAPNTLRHRVNPEYQHTEEPVQFVSPNLDDRFEPIITNRVARANYETHMQNAPIPIDLSNHHWFRNPPEDPENTERAISQLSSGNCHCASCYAPTAQMMMPPPPNHQHQWTAPVEIQAGWPPTDEPSNNYYFQQATRQNQQRNFLPRTEFRHQEHAFDAAAPALYQCADFRQLQQPPSPHTAQRSGYQSNLPPSAAVNIAAAYEAAIAACEDVTPQQVAAAFEAVIAQQAAAAAAAAERCRPSVLASESAYLRIEPHMPQYAPTPNTATLFQHPLPSPPIPDLQLQEPSLSSIVHSHFYPATMPTYLNESSFWSHQLIQNYLS